MAVLPLRLIMALALVLTSRMVRTLQEVKLTSLTRPTRPSAVMTGSPTAMPLLVPALMVKLPKGLRGSTAMTLPEAKV